MLATIKKSVIKHRLKFIIATTILFAGISISNFIFIYSITAQSNDECLWTNEFKRKDSMLIMIDQVKEGGVSWQAGIRNGDKLLAIDGKRALNTFIATQILDKVQKGDYATYTIQRGDLIFDTPVLVKKLINIQGLAFFLLSSLWLIVGFIVIIVKPNGRSQTLFYRIGLILVLMSSSSMLYRGYVVDNPLFRNQYLFFLVDNVSQFAGIFLPFMLFKFFSIFPKDFSYVSKKWFQNKIYFFPLVISIIILIIKIFYVYIKRLDSVYLSLNFYVGIFSGLGFIFGFVLLVIGYLKLKTKQERIPIFFILIAYLVGVLALLYTNFLAPSIGGLIFNNPAYFTPIILIALLPLAFGYSIFRYALMDVSEIVRNTIVYGTATVSLAGIYFLLIYFIGQQVGSAISEEYQGVIAGLVFVLFAVVFQSTKDRFQELLTEKFYPEQFAFQKNLLKFSNDISVIVGIENILNSTEQLFVKSLRLHFFGIMLNNNGTERIYSLVRHQGLQNPQLRIYDENSAIEKHFLAEMALEKKAVIERQDFKHLAEGRFSVLLDEEIYTVIPLIIKSKVIGLLLFGVKYSGSQFTAKDMELLLAAASQTAVSIESARLYESELEKHKIERDLENARKIQESLLPKSFPNIPGLDLFGAMISAMHVGGDYYDLIKISDKKLFVVIGDVSGKGLSASIYMSKLQTMIRLYCTEERTPKEILIELNKMIFPEIEKNWFITISLALIDLEMKSITISRAGHTPLIKINNDLFELYQPGGVGIGLNGGDLFASTLEEISIELKQGDLLFLFSDGITELMNSNNELYGFDNLKHFLTKNREYNCAEIGKQLNSELDSFRRKTHQYDDITYVILKIS